MSVRSTTASGSQVYESKRAVDEYLFFHYGEQAVQMPYSFGPSGALGFTTRTADICNRVASAKGRALDVGCSVGGSSFELAKHFNSVVGVGCATEDFLVPGFT